MARTLPFTAEGPGSIPGQGTRIPQAMGHGQKKKKKKRNVKRSCWYRILVKSKSFVISLGHLNHSLAAYLLHELLGQFNGVLQFPYLENGDLFITVT